MIICARSDMVYPFLNEFNNESKDYLASSFCSNKLVIALQKYELRLTEIPGSVIERISIATNCKRRYIDGTLDWDDTIDEDEQPGRERLLDSFDRLNDTGQKVAIERVEELAEIPKYRK